LSIKHENEIHIFSDKYWRELLLVNVIYGLCIYSDTFDIYKIILYKYNRTSTTIHFASFEFNYLWNMSHLYNVNEQVDNNLNNENCSILDESRRNLRLQSFVDRYGIEELKYQQLIMLNNMQERNVLPCLLNVAPMHS